MSKWLRDRGMRQNNLKNRTSYVYAATEAKTVLLETLPKHPETLN
jgi:hypothetical protein